MAPQIVGEDADTIHIQTDSGQVIPVAKSAVDSGLLRQQFGAPAEAPQAVSSPLLQQQMGASPEPVMGPMIATNGQIPASAIPPQSDPGSMPYGQGETYYGSNQIIPHEAPRDDSVIPQPPSPTVSASAEQALSQGQRGTPANAVFAQAPKKPEGMPNFDEAIKQYNQGFDTQSKGIKGSAAATAGASAEQASSLKGTQDSYMASMTRDANVRQDMDSYAKSGLQDIQKAQDAAFQAGQIDPNRYMHGMGTGGKIAAGIGILLGGIAGGLNGKGGNVALDVIDKAIDRDIDAQKHNALSNRQAVSDKINLYDANMKRFGNNIIAEEATRNQLLGLANLKAQEMQAKMTGGQAAGSMNQQLGQLQQAHAESTMKLQQMLMQQRLMTHVMSGQGVPQQSMMLLPENLQKTAVPMPGGNLGFAYGDSQKNEVIKATTAKDRIDAILSRMESLQKESGRSLPYSVAAEKAAQLSAALKPLLNEYNGINRFSKEDNEEILTPEVFNPTSMRQGLATEKMKQLRGMMNDSHDALLQNNIIGYKGFKKGPAL